MAQNVKNQVSESLNPVLSAWEATEQKISNQWLNIVNWTNVQCNHFSSWIDHFLLCDGSVANLIQHWEVLDQPAKGVQEELVSQMTWPPTWSKWTTLRPSQMTCGTVRARRCESAWWHCTHWALLQCTCMPGASCRSWWGHGETFSLLAQVLLCPEWHHTDWNVMCVIWTDSTLPAVLSWHPTNWVGLHSVAVKVSVQKAFRRFKATKPTHNVTWPLLNTASTSCGSIDPPLLKQERPAHSPENAPSCQSASFAWALSSSSCGFQLSSSS